MFNALNRFISRLDGEDPRQKHQQQQQGLFGFQVLRNTNLQLAVEPWFDFIVGINGRVIDDPSPGLFSQEGQRTRTMHIPVPADAASLGLTLQWTSLNVVSNIWHVLDVPANSPADLAGLLPYSDYILGSPEGVLHGESGLSEIVEDHIGRPLRLYVYNNEYDVTREVTLHPSREWGGLGALGCVLGYGALHRLPAPLSEPVDAPGDTIFDGGSLSEKRPFFDQAAQVADTSTFFTPAEAAQIPALGTPPAVGGGDFLVPAQLANAPPPSNAPPRGKKKDRHAHRGPGTGIDDYFNEQEQKSRELDRPETTRSKSPLAPPPKAGGPPKGSPPRADTPQQAEAGEGS
ncbi:hypothetical protein SLS53_002982 [Cytospora paraplurivora]|uniref:PDZ GRASP-type domain-containing protein n=1 Tax=Cytospora paraplurivora TaxID=2898453 RepID=A0AAN9UJR6_9PEZI